MQPGYPPFQLWFLTLLRKLVGDVQQLLWLAAANTSNLLPLQYDFELEAPIDFEKLVRFITLRAKASTFSNRLR